MTNVFISWSGDLSKEIAEELRSWIPSVLQFAKPYFTPNDIEKGAKWSSEISKKLSETNVGIICLTKENFSKPWILFEAGALSKDLDQSKVCSVLFGMDNTDLTGPLVTFQTTIFNKSDFRKLMTSINESGGDRALAKETFDSVFNMWWPKLDEKIKEILGKERSTENSEERSERDILEEILDLSRMSARRVPRTYSRAPLPPRFVLDFFETMQESISLYAMDEGKAQYSVLTKQLELCGFLLKSTVDDDGELENYLDRLRSKFDDIIPF